jgi:hypothetical protein
MIIANLLIMVWGLIELFWLISSFADIYFFPGALSKIVFAPTFLWFFVGVTGLILILGSRYSSKLVSNKLPAGVRLLTLIFLIVWAGVIPLQTIYHHLLDLVRIYGDRELIYTRFYHLNINQFEVFLNGYKTLSFLGLFLLPLYLDWKKVRALYCQYYPVASEYFWLIMAFFRKKISKKVIKMFGEFYRKLFSVTTELFILLLAANFLVRIFIPRGENFAVLLSEICLYLISFLFIFGAALTPSFCLNFTRGREISLVILLLTLISVVPVFSGFGLLGKVVAIFFVIAFLFLVYVRSGRKYF